MLILKDCDLEPGDIVLVASRSNNLLVKFKQFTQAITTSQNKHGHREVVSVFVCTGKNQYGVICHNFEKHLCLSPHEFTQSLQTKTLEELSLCLLNYCHDAPSLARLKEILSYGPFWVQTLALQMQEEMNTDAFIKKILLEANQDRNKLIELINFFLACIGAIANITYR